MLATQAATVWAGDIPAGLFVAPATFSISVEENLLPGGNVFKDGQVVDTGQPGAVPSVKRLHTTEHSSNFSGRSTQIERGFASAQADNTGNGTWPRWPCICVLFRCIRPRSMAITRLSPRPPSS